MVGPLLWLFGASGRSLGISFEQTKQGLVWLERNSVHNTLHPRLPSIKGCLPSNFVFLPKSSTTEDCLSQKVFHQSLSIKGKSSSCINSYLPSKPCFHRKNTYKDTIHWSVQKNAELITLCVEAIISFFWNFVACSLCRSTYHDTEIIWVLVKPWEVLKWHPRYFHISIYSLTLYSGDCLWYLVIKLMRLLWMKLTNPLCFCVARSKV